MERSWQRLERLSNQVEALVLEGLAILLESQQMNNSNRQWKRLILLRGASIHRDPSNLEEQS
jgi:hypothetical protein